MEIQYQKTKGYWVYTHTTPDGMQYVGMSKRQPYQRWKSSSYKTTSLSKYIEQYVWENIEHKVLIDNLTKSQAEKIEDWFITKITADGYCINKKRSGGYARDNQKEYNKFLLKKWYKTKRDEIREQNNAYNEEHREERLEYQKTYREAHREQKKDYYKQRRSTPEGKIYYRVAAYNQTHTPIETPLEAKKKYLDWGYIPSYIKNDDLI